MPPEVVSNKVMKPPTQTLEEPEITPELGTETLLITISVESYEIPRLRTLMFCVRY